jgi:hypothetical protein
MICHRHNGLAGKRTSLLQRRQDSTVQDFREHWVGPHAAIACMMPGIARYTQNRVIERLWQAAGSAQGYDCDGIVELEFRDEQAAAEANASNAVRTLLPEDEPRFLDGITLCRVPSGARQNWPGMVKVVIAARLADESAAGLEVFEKALTRTECAECSADPVIESFHMPKLRHEAEPPHVFATLWFPSDRDVSEVFSERSAWSQAASRCTRRGAAWWCDALPIVGDGRMERLGA